MIVDDDDFDDDSDDNSDNNSGVNYIAIPALAKNANDMINGSSDDDPLLILKKRFAKGEISKEEYQEMKLMLE